MNIGPNPQLAAMILDYLRLEFGESDTTGSQLELSDLFYEGEQLIDGSLVSCWRFPSGLPSMLATALKGEDDQYVLGLVQDPNYDKYQECYSFMHVQIEFDNYSKSYKEVIRKIDKTNCESDDLVITSEPGQIFEISSTVSLAHTPPMISLYVDHNNNSYNSFGSLALNTVLTFDDKISLCIQIGDLDSTIR